MGVRKNRKTNSSAVTSCGAMNSVLLLIYIQGMTMVQCLSQKNNNNFSEMEKKKEEETRYDKIAYYFFFFVDVVEQESVIYFTKPLVVRWSLLILWAA